MSDTGDEIPEILEGTVPRGVERYTGKYAEPPIDEVPLVDPEHPNRATGVPIEEFTPQMLRISVRFDPRPLMGAVDDAVKTNDINKVIDVLRRGKIQAKAVSKTLVDAKLILSQ